MERSHLNGFSLVANFYVRRAFRIYPLSIVAVMTAVGLHLDSGVNGVPGLSHAGPVAIGRIFSNIKRRLVSARRRLVLVLRKRSEHLDRNFQQTDILGRWFSRSDYLLKG